MKSNQRRRCLVRDQPVGKAARKERELRCPDREHTSRLPIRAFHLRRP